MAKGNLFLGHAAGKVGDVVFSRLDGVQVTRARNRSPKNPQSALQQLQRVVMKSTSAAYSLMQGITDHSFQGLTKGTPNQSRFNAINVAMLRSALADVINSGDADVILSASNTNFAPKGSVLAPINAYRISEGTLPSVPYSVLGTGTTSSSFLINLHPFYVDLPSEATSETITYAQVAAALGLQKGDQITFVYATTDDTEDAMDAGYFNGFHVQRIIMEPADGDMSKPFAVMDASIGLKVNDPNPRNQFDGYFSTLGQTTGNMTVNQLSINSGNANAHSVAAAAVIVSRLVGNSWLRSSERLAVRPSDGTTVGTLRYDANVLTLGDAIRSYLKEANSTLYLNQAQ